MEGCGIVSKTGKSRRLLWPPAEHDLFGYFLQSWGRRGVTCIEQCLVFVYCQNITYEISQMESNSGSPCQSNTVSLCQCSIQSVHVNLRQGTYVNLRQTAPSYPVSIDTPAHTAAMLALAF